MKTTHEDANGALVAAVRIIVRTPIGIPAHVIIDRLKGALKRHDEVVIKEKHSGQRNSQMTTFDENGPRERWEGCICLQDEHHRNCPAIKTEKCHFQSLYEPAVICMSDKRRVLICGVHKVNKPHQKRQSKPHQKR